MKYDNDGLKRKEFINEKLIETIVRTYKFNQSQTKSKIIMNSKGFNQFKSYASSSGGKGLLPLAFGLGFLWLAQSSIYYGIILPYS